MATAALPLFHLYGDPPDDQAFDFIHIETISSRSSIHDWTIRAHRHRNLFQILLIERGGGEMTYETSTIAFGAPCAIIMPATIAHGFRFRPAVTDGWVMSFTEDVAEAMGDRRGEALARLKALAAEPVVPLGDAECGRIGKLAVELHEERFLARAGFRIAMRGLLALIAVEVRLREAVPIRHRGGRSSRPARPSLRKLVESISTRSGSSPLRRQAGDDGRPPQRPCQRATGTAGHLIHSACSPKPSANSCSPASHPRIAYDLFFDPSHFARFFRKQTGYAA